MNRFWVRLSIVIGLVVVVVVLFPILERTMMFIPVPPPQTDHRSLKYASRQCPSNVSPESMPVLQVYFENIFWERTLTTLLVGAMVGVVAGILSSRWLTAPLSRLQKAVQAISHHQLSTRVPEKGSLEVKSLARSFNQMAAELETGEALRRNLLADVSHELRHPAHLLQGNLQAIQDGIYPLDMQEIERLSDQAQHLTTADQRPLPAGAGRSAAVASEPPIRRPGCAAAELPSSPTRRAPPAARCSCTSSRLPSLSSLRWM